MSETKRRTVSARGLGKGLDSLIPEMEADDISDESVGDSGPLMVDIHQVEPNREQPRKTFDEEEMAELTDSIRRYGVLQPLLVQKKEDYYEIVAGERRWRAALRAGLKQIPVVIGQFDDRQSMEVSLIENIQRQDLNPVEEARAYQTLIDEFGVKHEEIAEQVSKSRAAVTNSLRLLKLDESVLEMLEEGKISQGHARALLAIEDADTQRKAAETVLGKGLSVRETEKLVKNILTPRGGERKDLPGQSVYDDIEAQLKESLGTKVLIKRKNEDQGKIEISYYSVDELERLLDILNGTEQGDEKQHG